MNSISEDVLVSVVSIYYNRSDLVYDSINSILTQRHKNLELIVIDDGSSDDTWEKLQSIDDPRLRVVRHENQGFVKSIRKAVELCSGEFVAIHGSGDISHPDRIARQLAVLMESPDVGVVGCYLDNVNVEKSYSSIYKPIIGDNPSADICNNNFQIHGGVMFRKSIYDKVGGYRTFFTVGQDHDLWLRMSEHTGFRVVPEVLYSRYVRLDGVGGGNPERRVQQTLLYNVAVYSHRKRLSDGADPLDTENYQDLASLVLTKESAKILSLCAMELAAAGKTESAEKAFLRGLASYAPLLPAVLYSFFRLLSFSPRFQAATFKRLIKSWYALKSLRTERPA